MAHLPLTLLAVCLCATLSAAINISWAKAFRVRNWLPVGAGLAAWTLVSLDANAADWVRLEAWMPHVHWVRALGLFWCAIAAASLSSRLLWTRSERVERQRRAFLRSAATTVAAAPVAMAGFGRYLAQRDPEVREVELAVHGLHPDLDGLRLMQISDLHLSEFVTRQEVRRAIDVANRLRAHVAFVTGDLITAARDPLDCCIGEIARLRADGGVYGCLGNHEIVAGSEDYTEEECRRRGVEFLRGRNVELRFGRGRINLAGVDYQRRGQPYLTGSHALVRPGLLNLLLSHNPDVFPVAARQGWEVTLAGHTHGGQVTLEYLHPALNPARFYTPYVYGPYALGNRRMYVTSGIGTVGVPVRWNTAPEVALIRLTAAPSPHPS